MIGISGVGILAYSWCLVRSRGIHDCAYSNNHEYPRNNI